MGEAMSYHADEAYDVYQEPRLRARKEHTCSACDQRIPPGHLYFRVFTLADGKKTTIKRCAACQLTHWHLREICEGEMWPDEHLNCGQDYEEEWGTEPPDHIANLPLMSKEDVQKLLEAEQ